MHTKPDPPIHDEDDGTWFQPASGPIAPGPSVTPISRTDPSPDDSEVGPSNPGAEMPGQHLTELPPTPAGGGEAAGGFATQANGSGGVNAFPTAESTGVSKDSDPGSGSALGSKEAGDWDASPPPLIKKGQIVFGKYHLLDMIGEGGMGQVWKVRHVELDSDRALKLIKPEIARNAEGWKRFRREARVMDRLGQHPNSVAIYDFKRVQSMAYIEMAFVRGGSLDKILKENDGRPMPMPWIMAVLRQLCSVLQEAHGHADEATGRPKPIVHRDLKPSNLMLIDNKPQGQNLKVLDFGIAKMVDDKASEDERTMELTGVSVFLGTAGYASPEQIRGDKEIDGRSDLYSTGVILYQLLTGELPFRGNRMAMLAAHMMRPPTPMKETNPEVDVPPAVEEVVLRCLAKDPDERYQTAAELFDAFSAAAGEHAETPVASRPQTKIAKPKKGDWKSEPRPAGKERSIWPTAAAVLLLVGLAGGGAAFYYKYKNAEKPTIIGPATKGLPEGYEAVGAATSPDGYPRMLLRKADGIRFKNLKGLAYIPENYEPETKDFHEWPDAIVRKDGPGGAVRFIRFPDDDYMRGDFRAIKADGGKGDAEGVNAGAVESDPQSNPSIPPHRVNVSSFYIQETEVTNGEIEDYFKGANEKTRAELREWRIYFDAIQESLDREKKDPANAHAMARLFPAVCISHHAATRYAREIGGRLPTEAEWELAAKSQLDNRLHAWDIPAIEEGKGPPRAHLNYSTAKRTERRPVKVMSYPDDKTDQNLFDMTGNVKEWCQDPYHSYAEIVKKNGGDPDKPIDDQPAEIGTSAEDQEREYVVRGGSFLTDLTEATTFHRSTELPNEERLDIGFRVVISCPRLDRGKAKESGPGIR